MELREKVARLMAQACNPGFYPEDRVYAGKLAVTNGGLSVLPPEEYIKPLWHSYVHQADVVIAALRKELEAAGIVWPEETNPRTPDNP